MQNENVGNKVEVRVTYKDGFSIQTILSQMAEIGEEELYTLMEKLRKMTTEDAEFLVEMICSYIDLGNGKEDFQCVCRERLSKVSKYEEMEAYLRAKDIFAHYKYRLSNESQLRGKDRDYIFNFTCKRDIKSLNNLISVMRPKADELEITSEYPFLIDQPIISINGDELITDTIDLSFIPGSTEGRIRHAFKENGILTMRDLMKYKDVMNIEGLGSETRRILVYVLSKFELKED